MVNRLIQRINLAARVLVNGRLATAEEFDIPEINPEEVAEAKTIFPMEKFFIFGHARSGTTLLTRLIRLHPEVHCNYQAHFFTRPPLLEGLVSDLEVRKWLSRSSNRWNRGQDLSPVILRAMSDFILERDARREGKEIVGDKSPNSLLNGDAVRLLQKVYPDARLIFLVRDGRDAVLSHRFQTFIDNPQHLTKEDEQILDSFLQDPQPFFDGERSLFTQKGITRAAHGWVDNVVETNDMARQLFDERYTALRFEDLLKNPWDVMTQIWSFLGASSDIAGLSDAVNSELTQNPDADWQQEKASKISFSLNKGKPGSWRDIFTQKDLQIFERIAGETLEEWGYEASMPDRFKKREK